MNDWNIQSRAHACQACGQAFADKQAYHTLLFDRRHTFERLDICLGCWQAQHAEGASDRKGFVSHWQGIYEVPPPPAPEPIRKENAESLLRTLMERNDSRFAAATFILAVMLERKRLLKVKEQFHRDGQRVFVYEHPKSGDLFTIPDPDLRLDRLEAVQRDVAALLEHGVPEPGAPLEVAGAAPAAEPVASEAEPVASEAEPVASEAEPVASEAEPVASEAERVASEAERVGSGPAPASGEEVSGTA